MWVTPAKSNVKGLRAALRHSDERRTVALDLRLCWRLVVIKAATDKSAAATIIISSVYLFVVMFDACHKAVKVALICSVLQNTEFFKFTFCKCLCNGRGHFSFILQNIFLVKLEERIQTARSIPHIHDISTPCLSFCIVKVHRHDLIQIGHFRFV